MTTHTDNLVRRLPKHSDATRAVLMMIDEMAEMWEGFQCDGAIIADRQRGAYVVIHVPLADCPEGQLSAYLLRNGDEFVCVPEIYLGEGAEFRGTAGNWYTVDDCGVLVAV